MKIQLSWKGSNAGKVKEREKGVDKQQSGWIQLQQQYTQLKD